MTKNKTMLCCDNPDESSWTMTLLPRQGLMELRLKIPYAAKGNSELLVFGHSPPKSWVYSQDF